MDFAFASAHDVNRTYAADIFNIFFNLLFSYFGQVNDVAVAGHYYVEHRHGVHIQLQNNGGVGSVGQVVFNQVHFVAYFLRGDVAVFFQVKLNNYQRRAFHTLGFQLVNTFNLVDGFFNDFADGGFHFLRAGAGQRGLHQHVRHFHVGVHTYAHAAVGHQPHDDKRQAGHNGQYGPVDEK